MNAFSRSWKLLQATWSVLRAEKSLALYPILAVSMVLLISLIVFGGGFALLYTHPEWVEALKAAAQSSEQGGTYPPWLKESASLLRKTWGEQLIGTAGLGLVFGLLMVLVVLGTGGMVGAATNFNQPALVIAVSVLGVILFAGLATLSSTLTAIYRAALYRYAAIGAVSEQFDQALISGAFKRKGRSAF